MIRRPVSVVVIAWLVLAYGIVGLGQKIWLVASPEAFAMFQDLFPAMNAAAAVKLPLEAHLAYSFVASAVLIVSGAFMLRGRNWARLLFLWFAPTSIVLTLMSTGLSFSFYAKSATYVLLAFLLLRGASSRYFRGVTSEAD